MDLSLQQATGKNMRRKSRSSVFACFSLATVLAVSSVSAQDSKTGPVDTTVILTETVESGILFINQEFIQPPYVVEATQTSVTINGLQCFERPDSPDYEFPQRRRRRGGDEQYERRGRSATATGNRITNVLSDKGIVVVETGFANQYLEHGGEILAMSEAMLTNELTEEQVEVFAMRGSNDAQRESWRNWILTFQSVPELQRRLQEILDESDNLVAAATAKHNAIQRMEMMTYPLTIVGMLLGVLALGHVLKWAARIVVAETADGESPETIQCAEIALLLMLAMSMIDLVWTILAGQAGVMREVNPIAAGFLQTPSQLVLFKVLATGLGCFILYAWRRRSQIQNATWWMCLVCVLLTFRWVVFDSVMN